MEYEALLRRAEDLQGRCERQNMLTSTPFLRPAEQAAVLAWARTRAGCRMVLWGGHAECERKAAFFLPDYLDETELDLEEEISAIALRASYGEPGHRDYLGAILAMGLRREWIGDIWIQGQDALVFCLPSVAGQIMSLEQAGRVSVKTRQIPLREVTAPARKVRPVCFTVQSLRFDAVLGELFRLSRTQVVKLIAAGAAMKNDLPVLKNDAPVAPGDVLSLRGYGKGRIAEAGGASRKGRIFVTGEVYE